MKKTMVGLILGSLVFGGVVYAETAGFTDQSEFEGWYADEVLNLKTSGIINGYDDGSFRPNDNITRAETAVMLDRMVDLSLSPQDLTSILEKYNDLIEREVPSYYANSLAMAASGYYLTDIKPDFLNDSCLVPNLDISSSYTVYSCGYTHVIHIKNDDYNGPLGATSSSIDKWFVSPNSLPGGSFLPSLFREE